MIDHFSPTTAVKKTRLIQSCNVYSSIAQPMIKSQHKQAYVQKTYQIFVRSIHINQKFNLRAHSNKSGFQYSFMPEMLININRSFKATAIDFLSQTASSIDKNIEFEIFLRNAYFSNIIFDVSIEKLAKQQKTFFRKQLKSKNGYIDYKFVNSTTKIIKQSQMLLQLSKKEAVLKNSIFYNVENFMSELQAKKQQIRQKTSLIADLEKQNLQALQQKDKINLRLKQQLKKIKEGMNIKVKVNSKVQSLKPKVDIQPVQKMELLKKIKQQQNTNKSLEDQISRLKTQLTILNQLREDTQDGKDMQLSGPSIDKFVESLGFQSQSSPSSQDDFKQYQKNLPQISIATPVVKLISVPRYQRNQSRLQLNKAESPLTVPKVASTKCQKSFLLINKAQCGHNQGNFQAAHGLAIEVTKNSLLDKSNMSAIPQKKSSKILMQQQKEIINRGELNNLQIKVEQQRYQKEVLVEQVNRYSRQIKKLRGKITQLQQQKSKQQREKAKMLEKFVNKLNLGDKEQSVKAIMKEMTSLNSNMAKEKDEINRSLLQLKNKLQQQQRKSKQSELNYSKLMLKCNMMNSELTDSQKNYVKSKEKNIQLDKQLQLEIIKGENLAKKASLHQKESEQLKEQCLRLQKIKEQLLLIKQENQILKASNIDLHNTCSRLQGFESINQLLQANYQKLQERHNEYKVKIVKLENDFNIKVKSDELHAYEQEMDRILVKLFQQVCTFEKSFYQVLQAATKTVLKSQQRYYDKVIASSITRKQELEREKDIKTTELTTKILYYDERLRQKLQTLQYQITNFQDGVRFIEDKINDMEAFKMDLFDIMVRSPYFGPDMAVLCKPPTLKSSASKSKVLNEKIQVLQEQPQQNQQQLYSSDSKESKSMQKSQNLQSTSQDTLQIPNLRKSIGKLDVKQSNYLTVSNRFQLTKLKHSISIKRSLLREGVQISSSKIFNALFQSTELIQSSKVFDLKKEMSVERMKIRDRQFKNFRQTSQLLKKMDTSLVDQRIDKDRIILHHQMREKDLQIQFDKLTRQYLSKQTGLVQKVDTISHELAVQQSDNKIMVDENNELRIQIVEATRQVQETSQYLLQLQDERDQLLAVKAKNELIIAQFEQAEKQLIFEVQKIKQYAKLNETTLKEHIQERDKCFNSLQVVHKKEVKKMHDFISMLETRISEESQENLAAKSFLEKSMVVKDDQIQFLRSKIYDLQLLRDNLANQLQVTIQQRDLLERDIQVYQKNITELAQEMEAKEKQILSLRLQIQSVHKQSQMSKKLSYEFKQRQERKKQEIIDDFMRNKLQAKRWQLTFSELSKKHQQLTEERLNKEQQALSLKAENSRLNELIKKREAAILNLQRKLGEKQLQMEDTLLQAKKLEREIEGLKQQVEIVSQRSISSSIRKRHKINKNSSIKKDSIRQTIRVFKTLEDELGTDKKVQQIKISDILGKEPSNSLNDSQYLDSDEQNQQEQSSQLCMRQNIDDLLAQKKEIAIMNQILTQQNSEFQCIINEVNAKLYQQQSLNKDLKAKLKRYQEKINEKQANIQNLINELIIFQKQESSLKKQNDRLKKNLEITKQCRVSTEITHKQLLQMRGQIENKTIMINWLRERLNESQNQSPTSQRPRNNSAQNMKSVLIPKDLNFLKIN